MDRSEEKKMNIAARASRDAREERAPILGAPMEIPASIQNITPECRRNRTSLGALEEALARIRSSYAHYHGAPENADVTWRVSLIRVEGGDK